MIQKRGVIFILCLIVISNVTAYSSDWDLFLQNINNGTTSAEEPTQESTTVIQPPKEDSQDLNSAEESQDTNSYLQINENELSTENIPKKYTQKTATITIPFVGKYTVNFYLALAVGLIGLLILFYLFYSLFHRPKNDFDE